MIKVLVLAAAFIGATQVNNSSSNSGSPKAQAAIAAKSIYDFKVEALDGGTIDFSSYKGKKILVVNTASKCGFTPQYEGLKSCMKNTKTN